MLNHEQKKFRRNSFPQIIQHGHNKHKTPKSSPVNVITASSSPNDMINPNIRSTTPEIMQPKMESSPPPSRSAYDSQIVHRQTVLMWGANHQNANEMSTTATTTGASPSNNNNNTRSPCQTPKSGTFGSSFNASAVNNSAITHEKMNKSIETSQQINSHHLKWNGNSAGANKEVILFPIHPGNDSTPSYSPSASSNSLHSVDSRYSNHNRHGDISNCEVWPSSSYSQYQYFPYHHVSNAHHQHPTSTQ